MLLTTPNDDLNVEEDLLAWLGERGYNVIVVTRDGSAFEGQVIRLPFQQIKVGEVGHHRLLNVAQVAEVQIT